MCQVCVYISFAATCARYFPLFHIFLLLLAQSKDWDSQNGYTESPSERIQLPCTFWSDLKPGSWLFIAVCKRCVSRTPQWFNVIIWIHLNHFALRGVFICTGRGVFTLRGVFLCIGSGISFHWEGCIFAFGGAVSFSSHLLHSCKRCHLGLIVEDKLGIHRIKDRLTLIDIDFQGEHLNNMNKHNLILIFKGSTYTI